jgi:hypothetical protein
MTEAEVLRFHAEVFNGALKSQNYAALEDVYSDDYMLVRPDGSVLNKQQVLADLRNGLAFQSIEFWDGKVRVYGTAGVLTGESTAVSSRNGTEAHSHFRLVAFYAYEGESIRLVHFQSTNLPK